MYRVFNKCVRKWRSLLVLISFAVSFPLLISCTGLIPTFTDASGTSNFQVKDIQEARGIVREVLPFIKEFNLVSINHSEILNRVNSGLSVTLPCTAPSGKLAELTTQMQAVDVRSANSNLSAFPTFHITSPNSSTPIGAATITDQEIQAAIFTSDMAIRTCGMEPVAPLLFANGATDAEARKVFSIADTITYNAQDLVGPEHRSGTIMPPSITVDPTQFTPEIAILGNGNLISDGDSTPTVDDDTDFGTVTIGSQSTHTFTIQNEGGGTLNITGSVAITDSNNFSLVQPANDALDGGMNTTFDVTCNPQTTGVHSATVSIPNNDDDEDPYNYDVKCEGNQQPVVLKNPSPLVSRNGSTVPKTDKGQLHNHTSPKGHEYVNYAGHEHAVQPEKHFSYQDSNDRVLSVGYSIGSGVVNLFPVSSSSVWEGLFDVFANIARVKRMIAFWHIYWSLTLSQWDTDQHGFYSVMPKIGSIELCGKVSTDGFGKDCEHTVEHINVAVTTQGCAGCGLGTVGQLATEESCFSVPEGGFGGIPSSSSTKCTLVQSNDTLAVGVGCGHGDILSRSHVDGEELLCWGDTNHVAIYYGTGQTSMQMYSVLGEEIGHLFGCEPGESDGHTSVELDWDLVGRKGPSYMTGFWDPDFVPLYTTDCDDNIRKVISRHVPPSQF